MAGRETRKPRQTLSHLTRARVDADKRKQPTTNNNNNNNYTTTWMTQTTRQSSRCPHVACNIETGFSNSRCCCDKLSWKNASTTATTTTTTALMRLQNLSQFSLISTKMSEIERPLNRISLLSLSVSTKSPTSSSASSSLLASNKAQQHVVYARWDRHDRQTPRRLSIDTAAAIYMPSGRNYRSTHRARHAPQFNSSVSTAQSESI